MTAAFGKTTKEMSQTYENFNELSVPDDGVPIIALFSFFKFTVLAQQFLFFSRGFFYEIVRYIGQQRVVWNQANHFVAGRLRLKILEKKIHIKIIVNYKTFG